MMKIGEEFGKEYGVEYNPTKTAGSVRKRGQHLKFTSAGHHQNG